MRKILEKYNKWATKFLIEEFYYKRAEIDRTVDSMAIGIDKMQTFYMVYSSHFEGDGHYIRGDSHSKKLQGSISKKRNLDGKIVQRFLQYLKKQKYNQVLFESDETEGIFTSEKAIKIFDAIRNSGECDFRKPAQRVLAFQLADGLLDKFEILEYAVLEALFFKSKGVESWSESNAKLRESFLKKIDHKSDDKKKKSIQEIIKKHSQSEIEKYFRRLREPKYIVDYYLYQKSNGYPLITGHLHKLWIEKPMILLKKIVKTISELLNREKRNLMGPFSDIFFDNDGKIGSLDQKLKKYVNRKSRIANDIYNGEYTTNEVSRFVMNKYFPCHYLKSRKFIASLNQQLVAYSNSLFEKSIVCPNNDLFNLIFEIFSDLYLMKTFGVCPSNGCTKKSYKKVFVKYPRANREYCSNKCAAYEGVYRNRKKLKRKG